MLLHFPNSAKKFKESNAFIGYQEDTAAAVVFQATSQLEKSLTSSKLQRAFRSDLLADIDVSQVAEEEKGSETWKGAVSFYF